MNPQADKPEEAELKAGEKAAEKVKEVYRWWDYLMYAAGAVIYINCHCFDRKC